MWPKAEHYIDQNILWKPHKAMYGLQALGLQRLVSAPNIYKDALGTLLTTAYVDDLLFSGSTPK